MSTIADLIAKLRAHLDEDERVARAASTGPWSHGNDGLVWPPRLGDPVSGSTEIEDAEHIARWDPAQVLTEIKIKRGLIELAEQMLAPVPEPGGYPAEARVVKTHVEEAESRAAITLLKILGVSLHQLAAEHHARLAAENTEAS